jgi:hypothetical protein
MRRGILALACLLSLAPATTIAGCSGGDKAASITSFKPASGTYTPGDEAISSLKLRNAGDGKHTFWVGYSVQDEGGNWHDAPAHPTRLESGESTVVTRSWEIPKSPPPPSGEYKVAMAVWSERPVAGGEEARLAGVEEDASFEVTGLRDDFNSLNEKRWSASSKTLGRGRLEPENVRTEDGELQLKIPANSFNGGEIKSTRLYQHGSYRARIKVADAPSSLTGFFLYKEPDLENELDIEIHNDSSGRILFTTYSNGEETNNVENSLPFDPTKGYHEYRFDFYPERVEFYADGELMHSFEEGLPEDPMNLYVNAWFPTWLAGEKPEEDRYTYVEWIRH